jgi:hypothetical protein
MVLKKYLFNISSRLLFAVTKPRGIILSTGTWESKQYLNNVKTGGSFLLDIGLSIRANNSFTSVRVTAPLIT